MEQRDTLERWKGEHGGEFARPPAKDRRATFQTWARESA